MAYFNDSTNYFAATPTDGNFGFYPDWSSMLAADAANIKTSNALGDHERLYPVAGPSTGTWMENYYGEHRDHRFVDWYLTRGIQILRLLLLNHTLQISTATLSRCVQRSNHNF